MLHWETQLGFRRLVAGKYRLIFQKRKIEMLMTFMAVSGWAFWGIILATLVLDVVFLSSDRMEPQAVFLTVGVALGVVLFTDAFAGVRISTLLAALAIYMAVGVVWSIKKWYSFVVNALAGLRKRYDNYAHKDAKGNETFAAYAAGLQPKASENKTRITGWMALWPFSVAWWILTWPRRAFAWLYERLSTLFDRISAHVWARAALPTNRTVTGL